MGPARRRLMRDFKRLQEDPPAGVSGAPTDNNIMIWNAVIFGPHDTPFEDGTFKLTIEFTRSTPTNHPQFALSQKCSIPMYMQMAVFVSTFCRIGGVLLMMYPQFSPPSSHC